MYSDEAFYKIFYFFLFSYAIYTCIRNCFTEEEDTLPASANNQGSVDQERNGQINGDDPEATTKRRELVRGRLEFRTIQPPKPPSPQDKISSNNNNDISHTSKDTSERDIEKGQESTTSTTTASSASSSSTPSCACDNDTPGGDADDPAISSNKKINIDSSVGSYFSIASLFNHVGLGGSEPRNEYDECCSICLDPYVVGDTVARLKKTSKESSNHNNHGCNHWFHEDCILEWLQNHDDCPLCRVDMIH